MHKGEAADEGKNKEEKQQTSAEIDAQVKQIKIDCRLKLHSTITVNLSSKSCQQRGAQLSAQP